MAVNNQTRQQASSNNNRTSSTEGASEMKQEKERGVRALIRTQTKERKNAETTSQQVPVILPPTQRVREANYPSDLRSWPIISLVVRENQLTSHKLSIQNTWGQPRPPPRTPRPPSTAPTCPSTHHPRIIPAMPILSDVPHHPNRSPPSLRPGSRSSELLSGALPPDPRAASLRSIGVDVVRTTVRMSAMSDR